MPIERIYPRNGIHQVVKASGGTTVYVAGQISAAEGGTVGAGEFRAQIEQVYKILADRLAMAGATMKDLVKTTTYLRNQADFETVRTFRAEYFGDDAPSNSTVVVSSLANPLWLIEMEAITLID